MCAKKNQAGGMQMSRRFYRWQRQFFTFCFLIVSILTSSCMTASNPLSSVAGVKSFQVFDVAEPSQEISGLDPSNSSLRFSPGSGLSFLSRSGDLLRFIFVTDRGPNLDPGPDMAKSMAAELVAKTKVFPLPEYSPRYGTIVLDRTTGAAQVESARAMKFGGRELSGRPPSVVDGKDGEYGVDAAGKKLASDGNGIDPEAIAQVDGAFMYVSEEYQPSILKVRQQDGSVVEWLAPGKGLPEIFAKRRLNRGVEAITITPGGALIALLQSTIELGGEGNGKKGTKTKDAFFIRGMRKQGGTIRQFAFPIDDRFKSRSEAKIGDIVSLGENMFIAIVQGKLANGRTAAFLQLVDTSGSCDLGVTKLLDGRELEFAITREEFLQRCKPAVVRDIVNLADLGWNHQKTEGVALIDDSTLVVVNDNDFGVGEDGPNAPSQLLFIEFERRLKERY
jgi:hypothetical protein